MKVLGISCYYHDAAACLLDGGHIVAAAEEERFTRKKHDSGFPANAIRYCLETGGVGPEGPDAVVFYDKPLLKFHRIMETWFSVAPRGLRAFLKAIPSWAGDKLWFEANLRRGLRELGLADPEQIWWAEHHESHAASAFYPSPFEEAAVLTLDGVGEWATTSLSVGEGAHLQLLKELQFPHSPGLLYSAFTAYTGFRVNSGEYKLMGLAPYGEPRYAELILDELIDLRDDGSFRLNMDYFGWLDSLSMTNRRFHKLLGGPPRKPESPISARDCDLARSVQVVTEEIVLRLARHAREATGKANLCLAGGVALNCVANGRLVREGIFDKLWIQPAAGDSGGALGAALAWWYRQGGGERVLPADGGDFMQGSLLGPVFDDASLRSFLEEQEIPFEAFEGAARAPEIARRLAEGQVVGVFNGRMEFGPRALGNRSILADPRSAAMQARLNEMVKFRETFRPFAPAVLEEKVHEYFELEQDSPYMLLVAGVAPHLLRAEDEEARKLPPEERVKGVRSTLPAITHVDGSARIQTVSARSNPGFYQVLSAFEQQTGCPVLVNTSFNVRGEPIVCSPQDALRCFLNSGIDTLALGPFLVSQKDLGALPVLGGALALD